MRKKSNILVIGGIKFRRAKEIIWQDAFKVVSVPISQFFKSDQQEAIKQTHGWYARMRKNFVICTEVGDNCERGDFTVIPIKPEIKVIC